MMFNIDTQHISSVWMFKFSGSEECLCDHVSRFKEMNIIV